MLDDDRLPNARRQLSTLLLLIWALGVIGVLRIVGSRLPISGFVSLALLVQFALRATFIVRACTLSREIGKTPLQHGVGAVLLALMAPIYNFIRPFQIARELVETSTTSDLPPVLLREPPRFEGYRAVQRQELVVVPPDVPTPAILAWQIAVVATFFAGFVSFAAGFVVGMVVVVLELLVFIRIYQRFAARVGHLTQLERAAPESGSR